MINKQIPHGKFSISVFSVIVKTSPINRLQLYSISQDLSCITPGFISLVAQHGTKLAGVVMIRLLGLDRSLLPRCLLNLAVGAAIPAAWVRGDTQLQMFVRSVIGKTSNSIPALE